MLHRIPAVERSVAAEAEHSDEAGYKNLPALTIRMRSSADHTEQTDSGKLAAILALLFTPCIAFSATGCAGGRT